MGAGRDARRSAGRARTASAARTRCGSTGRTGWPARSWSRTSGRDTLTLEPILGLPVIKDLIVDMKPFFDHYKAVMPFLINDDPPPTTERLQSPAERARFDDSTKCILCACCTTACPPFWGDRKYVGPAAIVNAHRFIFDSRDRGAAERLEILNDAEGVWRCRTVFNCTSACPRDIKVTQAIYEVKRALHDRQHRARRAPPPSRSALDPNDGAVMDAIARRVEKLRRVFGKGKVDALLVASETNVRYLTGFTGEASVLLVARIGPS